MELTFFKDSQQLFSSIRIRNMSNFAYSFLIDFVTVAYSFCFILNVCSCCKSCFAKYELVPATGFDE